MRSTLDNRIYIPCLAVADLISALLCSVFAIYALLFPVSYTNIVVCKLSWYTMTWSTFVAMSILMMIATQRYLKICHPLRKSFLTGKEIMSVAMFYITAFIIDSPILFMAGITTTRIKNTTEGYCDRISENYRTGSKHNFAIAYTVIELSAFPIITFGIMYFYFKVSSTLYKRMSIKNKESKTYGNWEEQTAAVGTKLDIPEVEIVDQEVRHKHKKRIFNQTQGQGSSGQKDSGVDISVVFEDKPSCSNVGDENPNPALLDITKDVYLKEITKFEIFVTKTPPIEEVKDQPRLEITTTASAVTLTKPKGVVGGNNHKSIETNKNTTQKLTSIRFFFKQHRYTLIFITITITYFVTYLPRMTLMLLETIDADFWIKFKGKPSLQFMIFLNRLHILNCIVNPFLYGIFDEKFKFYLIKLFKFNCPGNRVVPKNG